MLQLKQESSVPRLQILNTAKNAMGHADTGMLAQERRFRQFVSVQDLCFYVEWP